MFVGSGCVLGWGLWQSGVDENGDVKERKCRINHYCGMWRINIFSRTNESKAVNKRGELKTNLRPNRVY